MGKSSPQQPAAPNPAATAAAQASANKETAIAQSQLNQVNQVTPYGSLEYSDRGKTAEGIPQYTATQTLAPAQQQMLDLTNQAGIKYGQTANQQLGAVSDRLSQPLDFSSLGQAPQANQQAWDNAYNSIIQRNQPQQDAQRKALETQMANQGIGLGSTAYNDAMQNFARQQNDFSLGAQQAAMGQMGQQYALDSSARNAAINEMLQQRQVPLNELAAMLTGAQVQSPSFVSPPQSQVAPTDVMGAVYGSANLANNAYNTQMQQQSVNNQGLYSLLGAGAQLGSAYMWSDRALKTDIEYHGDVGGLGLYSYRYIWGGDRRMGFMADEVENVCPHAVREVGGFKQVNYAEVLKWLE